MMQFEGNPRRLGNVIENTAETRRIPLSLTPALSPQAGRGRTRRETPHPASAGRGRGPRSGRARGDQMTQS